MQKLIRKNKTPSKGALGFGLDDKITEQNVQNALNTLTFLKNFVFEDGSRLTDYQIAGIMGNGTEESGFDPNAWSSSKKYNGYWQNNKAIRDYMQKHYGANNTPEAYHKFLQEWLNSDGVKNRMEELSYGDKSGKGYRAGNHSSVADSTRTFQDIYERNNGIGRANRIAWAEKWYKYLQNTKSKKFVPITDNYVAKPDAFRVNNPYVQEQRLKLVKKP